MLALMEWPECLDELIETSETQTSIAERLGITQQSVGDWLSLKSRPGRDNVRALAKAFNWKEAELGSAVQLSKDKPERPSNRVTDARMRTVEDRMDAVEELVAQLSTAMATIEATLPVKPRPGERKREDRSASSR